MGMISFIMSVVGMVLGLLGWSLDTLGLKDYKLMILSYLLPVNLVILGIALIMSIISYAIDSKRDFALVGAIISLVFILIVVNNLLLSFQILINIKA